MNIASQPQTSRWGISCGLTLEIGKHAGLPQSWITDAMDPSELYTKFHHTPTDWNFMILCKYTPSFTSHYWNQPRKIPSPDSDNPRHPR
jgi:hypothetical protein